MSRTPSVDIEAYWNERPLVPSQSLARWVERIRNGWRPNRRIQSMGYYEQARFFSVYLWEYFHVLVPLMEEKPDKEEEQP